MRVSGIYKIVNKINGKYYVGSSKNISLRWRKHKEALISNRHINDYLQNAWNKYGENSFEFVTIETAKDSLLIIEQKYLDIAKMEQHKCYNLNYKSNGGDISDYSRKKISESRKNHIVTEETKCKIRSTLKEKYRLGLLNHPFKKSKKERSQTRKIRAKRFYEKHKEEIKRKNLERYYINK